MLVCVFISTSKQPKVSLTSKQKPETTEQSSHNYMFEFFGIKMIKG